MKTLQILSLIALSVFLVGAVNAWVLADGWWEGGEQILTIEKGESATFYAYLETHDLPMDVSVKMYNSNNQLIRTFIDDTTEAEPFFAKGYEIRESTYENLGTYEIRISGSDNAGDSDNHVLTLKVVAEGSQGGDTTAPEITIYSPSQTTYTSQIKELHYKILDTDLDVCEYSTDNGETRNSLPCRNGQDSILYLNSRTGQNTWTVYARDQAGNEASKTVTFRVNIPNDDTTAPIITIVSPEDRTYRNSEIQLRVLTNEDAIVWFSLDGKPLVEMNNPEDHIYIYTIKVADGRHEIEFFAEDDEENESSKTVSFRVDTDDDDNDRKKSSGGAVIAEDEIDRERYINQFAPKTIDLGDDTQVKTPASKSWLIWLIVGLIVLIVLLIIIVMAR